MSNYLIDKKFGFFSFIIAIVTCILAFIVVPVLTLHAIADPTNAKIAAADSMGIIGFVLAINGMIFGNIGRAKDDKKTFATIGSFISIICLIFVIGAIIILGLNKFGWFGW